MASVVYMNKKLSAALVAVTKVAQKTQKGKQDYLYKVGSWESIHNDMFLTADEKQFVTPVALEIFGEEMSECLSARHAEEGREFRDAFNHLRKKYFFPARFCGAWNDLSVPHAHPFWTAVRALRSRVKRDEGLRNVVEAW